MQFDSLFGKALRAALLCGDNTRLRTVVICALLSTLLPGCGGVPLSAYDSVTYSNLTGLKAETELLLESLDWRQAQDAVSRIESTELSLRKAFEYEKGKGATNAETTRQLQNGVALFERYCQEYRESGGGSKGPNYFHEAAKALGRAFDTVIALENLKQRECTWLSWVEYK